MFRRVSRGLAALAALAAVPAAAQSASDNARFRAAQERFDREMAIFRQEFDRYRSVTGYRGSSGYVPPAAYDDRYRTAPPVADPRYDDYDDQDYDAARYYRSGNQYQERVLANDDRVYRGYDGRYYCRRSDGTTGLIVGAAAGGILGNIIDGGRSRIVGTLLGGAAGGLAGRAVEQNQIRCR